MSQVTIKITSELYDDIRRLKYERQVLEQRQVSNTEILADWLEGHLIYLADCDLPSREPTKMEKGMIAERIAEAQARLGRDPRSDPFRAPGEPS